MLYVCVKIVAMPVKHYEIKDTEPQQILEDVGFASAYYKKSRFKSEGKTYVWQTRAERISLIRKGVPVSSIEVLGERLHKPIKSILGIVGMPQTTYNKRKSEHAVLDSRNTELILLMIELLDYGQEVFNQEEEKFLRWLAKPNLSLNGIAPIELMDTITGLEEVKSCLDRLEYGAFA
jgi:putative toxin-antitoxin system antitoxin component (TIGR02293 family)